MIQLQKRPAAGGAVLGLLLAGALALSIPSPAEQNLIADPSFEQPRARDQFGHVFTQWGGWIYEGDCRFEVGSLAHSGKTSALLACSTEGKIRIDQSQDLQPGRYRITAWVRGVDIGTGQYNRMLQLAFNGKLIEVGKNGTFGWSRLTYVADLDAPAKTGPAFWLFAPGMLWIDDVSMERVGSDVALTPKPVLEQAGETIAPPGPVAAGFVRCPRCRRRNMPEWHHCYACGEALEESRVTTAAGPPIKSIASFESVADNHFTGGAVVAEHATDGSHALRIDAAARSDAKQDWSGYDFLKMDVYTDADTPQKLAIEIHDQGTKDYWTRVNYATVIPPGSSTVVLPLHQIYVGEKSRPGRYLMLNAITRIVLTAGSAASPLFVDHLRLERDSSAASVFFDGLYAFDFGPGSSPVMDGFTPITPATLYDPGRGYGLKDAKIWRAVDALQPDPLYQDFLCIESGGLSVDVPNGRYRVFVNIDSPGGYWGEVQTYRQRSISAQGRKVVEESMTLPSFTHRYFQFWDQDDLPSENTFDKYDRAHFSAKTFDVDVTNGRLDLEFAGQNWANSVSTVILFPVDKAAEGQRFLDWVREKRRFYFDNSYKRILHHSTGDPLAPAPEDERRGYVLFARDYMQDVYYNDTPWKGEVGRTLSAEAFAGEEEPLTLGVLPLRDLGPGTITAGALSGPQGAIPASAVDVGYVSYRLRRLTDDGGVYTIAPRYIVPRNSVTLPKGVAREYWLTVHVPAAARPGIYSGKVTFTPQKGAPSSVPLQITVRRGVLAEPDIPIGPFGGRIGLPWFDNDRATTDFGADMTEKSLHLLRSRHFTMFTGVPYIRYPQFRDGKPLLDFSAADAQMRVVRQMGFLAVSTYGAGVIGMPVNHVNLDQMKAAGYSDYNTFLKAIYGAIQAHAEEKGWPAVYWNITDEPAGEEVKRAIELATSARAAFPKGPPFFTGATSISQADEKDGLRLKLAEALHIPALNVHDETLLQRLLADGGQWAFYNNTVSRWTFGEYLYKAVREFHARYRLGWHWNIVAGDPYYALDCREDDYAWANANPQGQLITSLEFQRIAAGVTDYRYLITLAALAKQRPGTPEAQNADHWIARRLAAIRLGDTTRDPSSEEWRRFRTEAGAAIESLSH